MLQDILSSNGQDRKTISPGDVLVKSSKVQDFMRVGYKKPDVSLELAVVEKKTIENKIIAPPPKPKLAILDKKPDATFLTGAIKEGNEEDECDEGNKFI